MPAEISREAERGEGAGKLVAVPVSLDEANAFVRDHHRHHQPVVGHKFSLGAAASGQLVGVVIVGRPVSRVRDDGRTLEVTRLCTDGTRNACSFLYGRAAKAAFALGYSRVGTYIRADEDGTSLRAAGWRLIGETKGRSWDCQSRPRQDRTDIINRSLFEASDAGRRALSAARKDGGQA
jgi:hypothetical protein